MIGNPNDSDLSGHEHSLVVRRFAQRNKWMIRSVVAGSEAEASAVRLTDSYALNSDCFTSNCYL
jgi:hypothetical protein